MNVLLKAVILGAGTNCIADIYEQPSVRQLSASAKEEKEQNVTKWPISAFLLSVHFITGVILTCWFRTVTFTLIFLVLNTPKAF